MPVGTELPESGVAERAAGKTAENGIGKRGGLIENLRRAVREAQVAKIVEGKVSGEEIAIPGVAKADIDVLAPKGARSSRRGGASSTASCLGTRGPHASCDWPKPCTIPFAVSTMQP